MTEINQSKTKKGILVVLIAFMLVTVSILTYVLIGYKSVPENLEKENDFDVDLVYLWCDGEDPAFATRKNEWLKKEGIEAKGEAAGSKRFIQVDELKYSLRSVEKYVPWVRHIYIVTDRQVPKWLNTKHPKITVVDHSEIIPKKYIPTFNTNGIQATIHKISGLSEHFLLADDDTFFNRPVEKDFFFPTKDKVIFRFQTRKISSSLYARTLSNSLDLIKRDFKDVKSLRSFPHHNVDAYLKSDYAACVQHYNKEYTETLSHKFRTETDVQRIIVAAWHFLNDHALLKKLNNDMPPPQTPPSKVKKSDSLYMKNTKWKHFEEALLQVDPALFCINDAGSQKGRKKTREFLDKWFPNKSQFEK